MWKDGQRPCGCKDGASTGGVEEKEAFSTGAGYLHIAPQRVHNFLWKTHSYRALILVVISLMISAFSGSVFTESSMRFRALRTVL